MARSADFIDAHRRHWEDAMLLFERTRWANADLLFGYSAECGLKAIMLAMGMSVDKRGAPRDDRHRKHVHELWPEFFVFARKRQGNLYRNLLPHENPFADWSHHDRYAGREHFREENVTRHRKAARAVMTAVGAEEEDGLR